MKKWFEPIGYFAFSQQQLKNIDELNKENNIIRDIQANLATENGILKSSLDVRCYVQEYKDSS